MRISYWMSDVFSSELPCAGNRIAHHQHGSAGRAIAPVALPRRNRCGAIGKAMLSKLAQTLIQLTKPLRYGIDNWLYARSPERGHIASLKDACKGKPMLVVGNGPSLNQTPLEDFIGVPAIGMKDRKSTRLNSSH